MTSAYFLGIDPGKSGAWALTLGDGTPIWVADLPYVDNLLDIRALTGEWRRLLGETPGETVTVAIEHPLARSMESPSGHLTSGINFGALRASCLLSGMVLFTPLPATWKQRMGLTANKETSRLMAQQLFPTMNPFLKRKMDEGRAEALLLAEWRRRMEHRIKTAV
jgi:hypothetical protein